MKKSLILLIYLSLFTNIVSKTFVREYTYNASEADSKISSRTLALEQVKGLLLQEIAIYIESEIEYEEWEIIFADSFRKEDKLKKKINSISAGVVNSTTILEEKWDGEKYYLKVKMEVDINDINEKIDTLINNKQLVKELEESKERIKVALFEIENLRVKLNNATSEKEKSILSKQYKEMLSSNIFDMELPVLEGHGSSSVEITNIKRIQDYKKEAFIISFAKALLEIMSQVVIVVNSQSTFIEDNYWAMDLYYEQYGLIDGFEISSLAIHNKIESYNTNVSKNIDFSKILITENDTKYVIVMYENQDRILLPTIISDFPEIEKLSRTNHLQDYSYIINTEIKDLSYKIEDSSIKCTIHLKYDNRVKNDSIENSYD